MAEQQQQQSSSSLEECLKLLSGPRDEQRLAGLLIASKLINAGDNDSILKVHSALGPRFLDRLLVTGMGKGTGNVKGEQDKEAYLKLALTVLAAFARVGEIASSPEMVARIPVVAEILSKSPEASIYEECYELLLLLAAASEKALAEFYDPKVIVKVAQHASTLPDGSKSLEHSLRLFQLVLSKLPMNFIDNEHLAGVSCVVALIARHFGMLQNALKFDALHLLTVLLSSKDSRLYDALRSIPSKNWDVHIRTGIRDILQSRVVPAKKLEALLLAESMMSILGEEWLIERNETNDLPNPLPVNKFLLLVLETSRVEAAVLLNEIAQLKYDSSQSSRAAADSLLDKQRSLIITFSLIEKIVKLVSNSSTSEGSPIEESTISKVIKGLDETISLILEFLQDCKDHGQRKGDDLLVSVRIIGSYLAEAPYACKEKTRQLMEFMLLVEGEDEPSPFYSVCFLLPMLCQITMEIDGCEALLSFQGHKSIAILRDFFSQVFKREQARSFYEQDAISEKCIRLLRIVDCLVKMIGKTGAIIEESTGILLGCDTILNILLNKGKLQYQLESSDFVDLLKAFAMWTGGIEDPVMRMICCCICSLIFDSTSEEALLKHHGFNASILERLSQLIAIGLNQGGIQNDGMQQVDLYEILTEGYSRWAVKFPQIRRTVENQMSM